MYVHVYVQTKSGDYEKVLTCKLSLFNDVSKLQSVLRDVPSIYTQVQYHTNKTISQFIQQLQGSIRIMYA